MNEKETSGDLEMKKTEKSAEFLGEKSLGKGEVEVSITSGSTTLSYCNTTRFLNLTGGSPWSDCSDRLWALIKKGAPQDCWPWQGGKSASGYGRFRVGSALALPHRISYELAHGQIPAAPRGQRPYVVMHTCDNPPCCNPNHLKLGTYRDNARDMVAKGRQGRKMAPHNEALLPMILSDPRSVRRLAAETGIPMTTIARLRRQHGRQASADNPGRFKSRPFPPSHGVGAV